MTLTFKDVAEILKIIDASKCEEVVLELAGVRLEVRRGTTSDPLRTPFAAPISSGSIPAPQSTPAVSPGAAHAPAAAPVGTIGVRAPSIGVFYRRPSPTEKPFVEVGQRVKAGDPLCLIEVMKLYTTMTAPADGVIAAVYVADSALVEFDELLITIKPS